MKAFLGGLLGGLVVGALLTTIASRVIDSRRDHWPDAVMTVIAHEFGNLREQSKQGQCASAASTGALQRLQLMAQDVVPALNPAADDRVFGQYATDLGTALAKVATAGADCRQTAAAVVEVGNACQACHRDYR